jgi:iron complex outermembrane receptor protein
VSTVRTAYRSRYFNSDDQSLIYGVQPGFAKTDLRFEFREISDRWHVALLGKNITSRYTYSFANAWAVTATPTAIKYLDEPRTISLEAGMRF